MTKTNKILITVLIVLILVGLCVMVIKSNKNNQTAESQSNISVNTTTTVSGVTTASSTGKGYTITQISSTSVPQPIPNLSTPVIFGDSTALTPDVKSLLTQKITALQTTLKANPANPAAWIQLGVDQKIALDFSAALASWQYASKLNPVDYTPVGDLADLNAYYLHNIAQAEMYYKEALSRGPAISYLYVQYAEFYRDVVKNTAQALTIVNQGLAKIPTDKSLLELQKQLQGK